MHAPTYSASLTYYLRPELLNDNVDLSLSSLFSLMKLNESKGDGIQVPADGVDTALSFALECDRRGAEATII